MGAGEHLCRRCATEEETRDHLVLGCKETSGLQPWDWVSWVELDDNRRWRYTVEGDGGEIIVRDTVEDFFKDLDEVLMRVGQLSNVRVRGER